ncbi:aspartyl-phosphate phosphatase Spo0E family protein [Pontibacillus marinus]|nr:aspartyl-phosphate phosphatase Spo0E family protein [Pontibacillus marinus]
MMKNMEELSVEIEFKKEEMIRIANETGLLSEDTLEVSQELDRLLVVYQKQLKGQIHVSVP